MYNIYIFIKYKCIYKKIVIYIKHYFMIFLNVYIRYIEYIFILNKFVRIIYCIACRSNDERQYLSCVSGRNNSSMNGEKLMKQSNRYRVEKCI